MSAAAQDVVSWQDDDPPSPRSQKITEVARSLSSLASLSQFLRIIGALAIVGSMSVFLLQGWQVGNDVQRYLMLLGQTALLAVAGFALSHGLKETKGARVFFGLALASIPANFTILGALFYSSMQWDAGLSSYPDFASWQIVDPASATLTLAGALIALVPLAWLCFSIMARHSARTLTLHFLVLNSLLLLPLRGPLAVGAMAMAGLMYALFVVPRLHRRDGALSTLEGKFAVTILFAPLVIIVLRSVLFYDIQSALVAMLSVAAYLLLRHMAGWPGRSRRVAVALDSLSLPVAINAAAAIVWSTAHLFGEEWVMPLFALVVALPVLDIVRRTPSHKLAQVTTYVGCLMIGLSLAGNALLLASVLTATVCSLAGLLMVFAGYLYRQRFAQFVGWIMVLCGLLFGIEHLAAFFARSGWVELAVLGVAVIAAASVLERHGLALRMRVQRLSHAVRARVGRDVQPEYQEAEG